jgi:hypothetical protein
LLSEITSLLLIEANRSKRASPTDVKNHFPEPGYGLYNFHIKDRFENYLHRAVCNGSISLTEAQKQIANDWISYWKNAGQS